MHCKKQRSTSNKNEKAANRTCVRQSDQNTRQTLLLVCLEHGQTQRVMVPSLYKQPAASTDKTSGHCNIALLLLNDAKKEVVLEVEAEVVEGCESSC